MTGRTTCGKCERPMTIVAAGMCRTCYRYERGHDQYCGQCVGCRRIARLNAKGQCWTCYRNERDPNRRKARGPQPSHEWQAWSYMFARPDPVARLQRHEVAALVAVNRIWYGTP